MSIAGREVVSVVRAAVIGYLGEVAPRRDPGEFIDSFSALSRCLRSLAAQAYAQAAIGSTQAKFVRHIGRRGGISQAELARATGTDPTLTGRALQTLIERGWVRRQRSATDCREYLLELGPAGKRVEGRVQKLRAALARRVVATLDARDLQDFDRITAKILAAFEIPPAAAERHLERLVAPPPLPISAAMASLWSGGQP